ncbi:MAG: hypothetical protein JWN69_713 [Alphaproteobacteria bacterium]|nr:hypothetical protein [Alphaproteobacteria bacterium]
MQAAGSDSVPHFFSIAGPSAHGEGRSFGISGPDPRSGMPIEKTYSLSGSGQQDYLDLFAAVARDFGTRTPRNRHGEAAPASVLPCRPLLTANISPDILYGYGDPAVLRVEVNGAIVYYLVVTSNDAPNAFPLLRSTDLEHWRMTGFVFPEGRWPGWMAQGAGTSDCWAPELHRVGADYLLCFSARAKDGSLAIAIATSSHPGGPYSFSDEPLLAGGVIDPNIFVDADGSALLLWKEDSNDRWPALLAALLHEEPSVALALFDDFADRRTAALAGALWPTARELEPMERFFALQPLIEAAVDDFSGLRERLARLGPHRGGAILDAMRTPIFAQPLSPDGQSLTGSPQVILVNDLAWEGHLIEGPWLMRHGSRYYLFYSGNDFSTADYGIGVAVASSPLGPFLKMERPILRSSCDWAGPGHPSAALGPDGVPRLFFHAFVPGQAGYKAFRALLSTRLAFRPDGVDLLG